MTDVIELRVHGVGGSSPEALLGVPCFQDAALVAGDTASGFYARRDNPSIEGYVWGGLTSGSLAQTLWILLLPFTLFNVAGWTYGPNVSCRWSPARQASRILLGLFGLTLTLTYLFWTFAIVAFVALKQEQVDWAASFDDTTRLGASTLVVAVIGVVVYRVARMRQRRFEGVRGPTAEEADTTTHLVGSLVADQRLNDPNLWAHERLALTLLRTHVGVAGVGLVGLGAWALSRDAINGGLDLQPLFRWHAIAQLAIVVILMVIWLFFERPTQFRWAAPVVLTTTSLALATGFFSGLWELIGEAIKANNAIEGRPLGQLNGSFGGAMLGFLAAVLVWAGAHALGVPRRLSALKASGVPRNSAPVGREENGLSSGMTRKVAWVRAFSQGPRRVDLVLTSGAVVFLLLGAVSLPGWVRLPTWTSAFGQWAIYAIVVTVVPFFIWRARRPDAARRIAIVWDVLTFFPRRFHPFAVRPYAERAVPELTGRIADHVGRGRKVILSGHSQGTVLSVAALTQFASQSSMTAGRVAQVTLGSPLRQLYCRFFPELFQTRDFETLRSRLFSTPRLSCAGWKNFFRQTDYVGQRLFACTDSAACDRELHDPPSEPALSSRPLSSPLYEPTDPPPAAWVSLTVHSVYFGEIPVRAWVRQLRDAMK